MSESFHHVPVLLREVLDGLDLKPGCRVLDCTLGGGGHSQAILRVLAGTGWVTGLDCDQVALAATSERLAEWANFSAVRVNFGQLSESEWQEELGGQDRVLMDLGVSSPQLDRGERGFSIRNPGPLDMRMDQRLELSAREVVADYSEAQLRRIFFEFGEESGAGRVARRLVQERARREIVTTSDLLEVVEPVLGRPRPGKVHPATKIFQALRMEVNGELENLKRGLLGALEVLKPGGRLVVLSYHSLEDRCVKYFIRERQGLCKCPRGIPVCGCGAVAELVPVGGAIKASAEEVESNPRARSVRMRIAEKVGEK